LSSPVHIRPCTFDDADALALIGQATFLETFAGVLAGPDIVAHCQNAHAAQQYQTWLADPSFALWIAEVEPGHAPVGFMVLAPAQLPLPDLSHRDVEVKRIYILSKFQGGGTGSRLLHEALRHAGRVRAARLLLGVYADNHAALGFYERHGFRQLGSRMFNVGGRDYDDRIMGKALDAGPSSGE
jgi:ribosomal protein S18 acetylase RimI-like enzyme